MAPHASSRPLTITADDTTGALESAAGMADAGGPSFVVPYSTVAAAAAMAAATAVGDGGTTGHASTVIDLRSRHLAPAAAADRLSSVLREQPGVRAHKIDSTLRGNWRAEIAAVVASGRRVLMVPAYPAAGRVCRGGVVSEHGVPVDQTDHARDPRSPVLTSRPASKLPDAVELPTASAVATWLAGTGRVAVADAETDQQLADIVQLACATDDVFMVGTAATIAAMSPCAQGVRHHDGAVASPIDARALIVCGSLHATSRSQIDALIAAGAVRVDDIDIDITSARAPSVVVLMPPADRDDDPGVIAHSLAARAHGLLGATKFASVVLVGGDTAEAFIRDRVVEVTGSIDIGIASGSIEIDGQVLRLVSKPGAFGSANTLVDLMSAALTSIGPP